MDFSRKGGGGLESHIPILKNDVFKNHLESLVVTMNMTKKLAVSGRSCRRMSISNQL